MAPDSLKIAGNGQAVTFVLGESWTWSGGAQSCPSAQNIAYGREFRYDNARQRYLDRSFGLMRIGEIWVPTTQSKTWSDYDGNEVYGDFTVDDGIATGLRSFDPGLAKVDPFAQSGRASTSYFHADMIGTTRFMTDSPEPPGQPTASGQVAYTAFGERIDGSGQRYAYAGAWGYQSHDDFPFLHVGARYYDPATGRFLQRDPIGIAGGLNVYAYVRNAPTIRIDPEGLRFLLPGATGPPDKGFTDRFWSKVHYTAGWLAAKAGMSFCATMGLAIRWERWEPDNWPFWDESPLNRIGDVFVAGKGWIDAQL